MLKNKSFLKIKNVGLNPTRIGFYSLLKNNGAKIKFLNKKKNNNELFGDIIIKSSKIKPIYASKEYYVKATDEYPILFAIAAVTEGVYTFKGIGDLANKESDLIKEMQKILRVLDYVKIYGKKFINHENKNEFLGDHRICMFSN